MKKRNYLISLLAVVLSLGVLVGCGDKTSSSNEGASVNSSENSETASSKDSADVAKDKGEADKAQAKEDDSKVKEARNKDDSEKKEENSNNDSTTKEKETSKVDNSNSKESKGASNSSKNDESKSTSSKKENTKAESSLSKAKSEYLQKMKKIDSESKKLDKEYDSDRGSTQAGMNGISGEQAKLYDDELNQIYDYLKQNLSKEKAKELEKSEMAWIKEKESNIAEIKKQYEGGSVTPLMVNSEVAKESKERCYYLIDNYMN
ncbi:lysozyme inhibitor LprI family protein [Clostridium perfringens]|uniref:lysozyme inhibitor LprI family protein n=1 Tax=Clostridium perfringens TaxID=1502 RepID=UPI003F41BD40|nr:hypothetical protein CPBEC3_24310 [Clostridium perfringens]HCG3172353.1 DUF1311 domain-containing protein [Clostridium perfringens]